MNDDVAALARSFARALEDLRDRWDVHYVGQAASPRLPIVDEGESSAKSSAEGASTQAPQTATSAAPEAEVAEGERGGPAQMSPAVSSAEGQTPNAPAPSPARPAAEASSRAAPPATSKPPAVAQTPAPMDEARRKQAAHARTSARREQAQTWSATTKLEYLRRQNVGDCQRCPLSRTRNSIVFGVGSADAELMFVGEAPGADEDRQGEPFVGRSGQLLNRWLDDLGLSRGDVYIANVLKCRPPGNRDPRPQEVDKCSPFLQAQIRAISPKVIVALGRQAGMLLSRREDMTLRAMRSTSRLTYDAGAPKGNPSARIRIPLVVTYHPAYVLRQEGGRNAPQSGRASPTEMVMADLERALSIVANN